MQGFEEARRNVWKFLEEAECSLRLKAVRQNTVVLIYVFTFYPHPLSLCARALLFLPLYIIHSQNATSPDMGHEQC